MKFVCPSPSHDKTSPCTFILEFGIILAVCYLFDFFRSCHDRNQYEQLEDKTTQLYAAEGAGGRESQEEESSEMIQSSE